MGRKEGIETYTRSRLIGYAQLLQEIAQEYKAGQKRTEGAEEACLPRSSLLLREQERENTTIFAGFVMDTSKQLENLAGTEFAGSAVCERQKKRIVKLLKEEGISVLEFYRTSNRNGYLEIGMVVKSENRCYYDVMEIADLLSEITHKSMLPVGGHAYIHSEPVVVCFQEEVTYRIFGGFAKATKRGKRCPEITIFCGNSETGHIWRRSRMAWEAAYWRGRTVKEHCLWWKVHRIFFASAGLYPGMQ